MSWAMGITDAINDSVQAKPLLCVGQANDCVAPTAIFACHDDRSERNCHVFGFHTQIGAFFAFFVCAGGGAVVAMACSLVGAGVAAASSFDAGLILGAASDAPLAFIGWIVGLDNEPLDTPGEGEPSVPRDAGCTVEGPFESTVLLIEHPPYQTYADATPVGSQKVDGIKLTSLI